MLNGVGLGDMLGNGFCDRDSITTVKNRYGNDIELIHNSNPCTWDRRDCCPDTCQNCECIDPRRYDDICARVV